MAMLWAQQIMNGKRTYKEVPRMLKEKVKEINKTMPIYKAIKGSIFTTEPLIKTTTNKLKRQANLEQILKEEKNNIE